MSSSNEKCNCDQSLELEEQNTSLKDLVLALLELHNNHQLSVNKLLYTFNKEHEHEQATKTKL